MTEQERLKNLHSASSIVCIAELLCREITTLPARNLRLEAWQEWWAAVRAFNEGK